MCVHSTMLTHISFLIVHDKKAEISSNIHRHFINQSTSLMFTSTKITQASHIVHLQTKQNQSYKFIGRRRSRHIIFDIGQYFRTSSDFGQGIFLATISKASQLHASTSLCSLVCKRYNQHILLNQTTSYYLYFTYAYSI